VLVGVVVEPVPVLVVPVDVVVVVPVVLVSVLPPPPEPARLSDDSAEREPHPTRHAPRSAYRNDLKDGGMLDARAQGCPLSSWPRVEPLDGASARPRPATTVEIDGQKMVAAKGNETFTLDFAPRMADTEIPFQTKWGQKLSLPVRLRSPDDVALEGTLDVGANLFEGMVSLLLQTVTQGPVRFGDEPEAAGSAKSLVLVGGTRMDEVLGRAKRVRDIDLVAMLQTQPSRPTPGQCGPYGGYGAPTYATRAAVDYEVTVHEHRTGKKLQTRTFAAGQDPCPESLTGKAGSLVVTSAPKMETIVAWLKS
jgi:hypothetical protein